jgi:hypothetical protein
MPSLDFETVPAEPKSGGLGGGGTVLANGKVNFLVSRGRKL